MFHLHFAMIRIPTSATDGHLPVTGRWQVTKFIHIQISKML